MGDEKKDEGDEVNSPSNRGGEVDVWLSEGAVAGGMGSWEGVGEREEDGEEEKGEADAEEEGEASHNWLRDSGGGGLWEDMFPKNIPEDPKALNSEYCELCELKEPCGSARGRDVGGGGEITRFLTSKEGKSEVWVGNSLASCRGTLSVTREASSLTVSVSSFSVGIISSVSFSEGGEDCNAREICE